MVTVLTVAAQRDGQGVRITNFRTEVADEMLNIHFDLSASGLEMKCDGQLTVEFAVESADRRLVLPVVVYSGKQRYRYEQRRQLLSDGYVVEPYHIYENVKKNKTYDLDYTLSLPYYTWMEHASVTWCEYHHDCSGNNAKGSGVLLADLNPAPVHVEPEVWRPDSTLYPNLVCFLLPEVEEVKSRASMVELNIIFPVNSTEVRPTYLNNAWELTRADSLVGMLQSNALIDIRGVSIRGYASPEGRYESNVRLARGRSEGFKRYMVSKYPGNSYIRDAQTSWVAEDWEGFGRMVENYDIPAKTEVLAIVNDPEIHPDAKDRMLQNILWWSSNYKVILSDMFPKLRRIELRVDYTVQKLNDSQARELLYTNPGMLSLDEMYRVAKYYEPGSKQYREVYEIAAREYPNDAIANNNAAASLLQEGKADEAFPYLKKTAGKAESLLNYGAYHYIKGELDEALDYFNQAKAAGIERADYNLGLIMD